MSSRTFLVRVRDGEEVERLELGPGAFHVGRGPGNHLVLADARVSWLHLVIWADATVVWVLDLQSTNGTWVRGRAITEATRLTDGDEIDVARAERLRVVGTPATASTWVVEDLVDGTRHVLDRRWFFIGAAPGCDVVVEGARGGYLLLCEAPERVWLCHATEARSVDIDFPLEVAGRSFRIHCMDGTASPTDEILAAAHLDYELHIEGAGTPAMKARLVDSRRDTSLEVIANNRVVLLYLLALGLREDLAAGIDPEGAGWCNDEALIGGVWGFRGRERRRNALHVLIHRVRAQLRDGGFDHWCVEKRDGFTRIRVNAVRFEGES